MIPPLRGGDVRMPAAMRSAFLPFARPSLGDEEIAEYEGWDVLAEFRR